MTIFERCESNVRSYCRAFPAVFEKAKDAFVYDREGKRYIDFFCGAGTMNYGHNNERMKHAVIDYLQRDGIIHSLDMHTTAKERFLQQLDEIILTPRGYDYKVQFVAPSGANAVEAALKLARMIKGRSNIIAFTNGYHGLSAGALSVTGNSFYRSEAFINRSNVAFMPFEGYLGAQTDTLELLERMLDDPGSGIDHPAAVICETIQAEGGVRVASREWLQRLEQICRRHDMLLILDDVQVGNGRTGTYFSFETMGITPDLVAFSKAVSGFGMPMALLFIRPELDHWKPGEHTGTFRGNNLAFVAACETFSYWLNDAFTVSIKEKGTVMRAELESILHRYNGRAFALRGRGMIYGLDLQNANLARDVATRAFQRGLMIELCGAKSTVLKFLPCLTIETAVLQEGFAIVRDCINETLDTAAYSGASVQFNVANIDAGAETTA